MAYQTFEEEAKMLAELKQMRRELVRLTEQVNKAMDDIKLARQHLIEAQARNRKLDWLLTKEVERG